MQTPAADEFAVLMLPVLAAIRSAGADTLEAMSCALNQRGIGRRAAARWYASSVSKLLTRAARGQLAAGAHLRDRLCVEIISRLDEPLSYIACTRGQRCALITSAALMTLQRNVPEA